MAGVVDIQLLLVRSLLDRASATMATGDDVSLMTAMLLSDVAVETITKMACREKGVKVARSDTVGTLLTPLAEACTALKGRSELPAVERLREARNSVQHSGLVPSAQNVSSYRSDGEAFATLVSREVFGREYHQLSVVSLVSDGDIQYLLMAASFHREADRPRTALVYGCAAFDCLLRRWARAILSARGFFHTHEAEMERFAGGLILVPLSRVGGGIFTLQRLEDEGFQYVELARMTMGFSIDELTRLKELSTVAERLPFEEMPESIRPPTPPKRFADPLPESEAPPIAPADVDYVIETVARQAWRLSAEHPGAFVPAKDRADPEQPPS